MNEIVWCYPPKGRAPKYGFHRKHDTLLYYRNALDSGVFFHQFTELDDYQKSKFSFVDSTGRRYKEFKGRRTYLDESKGRPVPSWWTDIGQTGQSRNEYNGYPTQKPLKLLERIIESCSRKGDLVLDPFCGCATTCVAAQKNERNWIGIDFSEKAIELVVNRLEKEANLFNPKIIERTDVPIRTDRTYRSRNIRDILYGQQHGNCAGCNTHFPEPRHFHIDHIVPTSDGGPDDDRNLQMLCGSCNSIKGNRSMAYLLSELKKRTLKRRK